MARGTAVASAVAIAAAAVTAALALASSRGWVSGAAVELLLVVGIVVVAVCVGWLVILVVIVGLLRAAASVFGPAPPRGLERIVRIMELQALARETAAAAERVGDLRSSGIGSQGGGDRPPTDQEVPT